MKLQWLAFSINALLYVTWRHVRRVARVEAFTRRERAAAFLFQ